MAQQQLSNTQGNTSANANLYGNMINYASQPTATAAGKGTTMQTTSENRGGFWSGLMGTVGQLGSALIACFNAGTKISKIGGAIKKYVGNERGENISTAAKVTQNIFKQVNAFNRWQFDGVMESVFGTTIKEKPKSRNFEMTKTIWVNQNLTLIKSVDADIMDKVRYTLSQKVIAAADKKILQDELVRDIRSLTGVSEKRAALIGADQVGKLNGMLTRYRQQSAGIERYIWMTMGDSRMRPAHRSRHGVSYRWDNPPNGGHPGQAVRCRCVAQPLIDEESFRLTPKAGNFTQLRNSGTIAVNINGIGEAHIPVDKLTNMR